MSRMFPGLPLYSSVIPCRYKRQSSNDAEHVKIGVHRHDRHHRGFVHLPGVQYFKIGASEKKVSSFLTGPR